MARHPYAAKRLADQLRGAMGRDPDSKAGQGTLEPYGDPDGLGVYRTFRLDKTASKRLKDALSLATLEDPRIEDLYERDGRVYVRFTGRTIADQRDPFPLDEAEVVTNAGGNGSPE